MANIAKRVQRELRRRNPPLSQNGLARELGISGAYLSHLLHGKRRMSLALAIKLESKTGIPARDFAQVA